MVVNNEVKICWIHGKGEQTVAYPIAYSLSVCPVITNTQSKDANALVGTYGIGLTICKVRCLWYNNGTVNRYSDTWVMCVIGT